MNIFDTQERVRRIGAVMVQGGTSDTLMALNETLVLPRGAGRRGCCLVNGKRPSFGNQSKTKWSRQKIQMQRFFHIKAKRQNWMSGWKKVVLKIAFKVTNLRKCYLLAIRGEINFLW